MTQGDYSPDTKNQLCHPISVDEATGQMPARGKASRNACPVFSE